MIAEILKSEIKGEIKAPPSKSMAHRYLIFSALREEEIEIDGLDLSEDISATIDCLSALGVKIDFCDGRARVSGRIGRPTETLKCRESGSTLRFMLPLCLSVGGEATLIGAERLMSRPLEYYSRLCEMNGFDFRQAGNSVTVSGRLESGEYEADISVSSQFVTGMIFALLNLGKDSKIRLVGKPESLSYIDLTLSAARDFGFGARFVDENTIFLSGKRGEVKKSYSIEGDYSNAAFFEALNYIGGNVRISGLLDTSHQGDKIYKEYFRAINDGTPTLSLADCPDLGPILFALAAEKNGAVFTDTKRLKIKESDRAEAMKSELLKLGASVTVEENRVIVDKAELHSPAELLCGHNDHRVVMSLAVLATKYGGKIDDAAAVRKSMPDFWDKLINIGAKVSFA